MALMEYKGYLGAVDYDDSIEMFHGRVINTRDTITFEGRSVPELRRALRDSIEVYLEMCADDGVEPNPPYSGKFVVRLDPALHRAVALTAAREHKSVNAFVRDALAARVPAE